MFPLADLTRVPTLFPRIPWDLSTFLIPKGSHGNGRAEE